jgi:hypothetical protein
MQFLKHRGLNTCLLFFALFAVSCTKELSEENGNSPVIIPVPAVDLTTQVRSSISGFVTNESEAAVMGATVKIGSQLVTTDKYGFFEVRNVQVVKNAATIAVSSTGYFPGRRTFIAEDGKSEFVRIKLIPKTSSGSFAAASGGTVTTAAGLKVTLPAGAVVNAATGAAYTGNVNVASFWLNPTAADLDRIMPGDLRALDATGALKQLTSFGMAAVELMGSAGEKLQVAPGKKATLSFPIPAALSATAASSIALWYFDETTGLWKEEGSALKVGNNYEGDVSHFSFWNCDVPANFIQLNCTIKDNNGNPVSFAYAKITKVNNPNSYASGYTDSSGYVSGAVPKNEQLRLDVFTGYTCGTPFYTQTFTTAASNLSLGVITVNTNQGIATVTGTVTNCTNAAVTNGFVILKKDNQYYRYGISSTGTFNFNSTLCNNAGIAVQLIAEDVAGGQQSTPATFNIASGNNAVGNLQACGVTTQQFLNLSINGTSYNYTAPVDSLALYNTTTSGTQLLNYVFYASRMSTPSQSTNFNFSGTGIAAGSSQILYNFNSQMINDSTSLINPINVNITEFGAIGQFISGNFTGTLTGAAPTNTPYNIVCSFRVRRYY